MSRVLVFNLYVQQPDHLYRLSFGIEAVFKLFMLHGGVTHLDAVSLAQDAHSEATQHISAQTQLDVLQMDHY